MKKLFLIFIFPIFFACSVVPKGDSVLTEERVTIDEAYDACVLSISDYNPDAKEIESYCKCMWNKEQNLYGNIDFSLVDVYKKKVE